MTQHDFPKLFHVLKSGTSVPHDGYSNKIAYRGEEFTVTAAQYEDTKNRLGVSWLDMTPEEQVERWGYQRFGVGPIPDDVQFASDDESVMFRRRELAVIEAKKLTDAEERKKAFDAIKRLYGAPQSSQRSTVY